MSEDRRSKAARWGAWAPKIRRQFGINHLQRVSSGSSMIDDVDTPTESELLAAARRGDSAAFERLVAGHRSELFARWSTAFLARCGALFTEAGVVSRMRATSAAPPGAEKRVPRAAQQAELDVLGADGQGELVETFVAAWAG